jgi:hypothetical protein
MTERIDRHIARFAPGFYERVMARRTTSTAELESRNANLIGGAITGGANDLWQMVVSTDFERSAVSHPDQRYVPLLFFNSSWRWGTRDVRVPRGECSSKIFARTFKRSITRLTHRFVRQLIFGFGRLKVFSNVQKAPVPAFGRTARRKTP